MLTHLDLLRLVAEYRQPGRSVPSPGQLAILLGMPPAERSTVWHALRELEAHGYITGVPKTPRGWGCYIRVLARGYDAIGIEPPRRISAPRIVRVRPISWRCELCGAATIDTAKPCAICPLVTASPDIPIFYEPSQGAA